MSITIPLSVRRFLSWCLLACMGMASIEALGYGLAGGEGASTLALFAQRFSWTCCVTLVAVVLTWLLVWFFLVWLGGVRSGIALFFMLLFFTALDFATLCLDMAYRGSPKPAIPEPVMFVVFAYIVLVLSMLVSAILGKILRNRNLADTSPRLFAALALALTGIAFGIWAGKTALMPVQGSALMAALVAAGMVAVAVLWWFGGTKRRLRVVLCAAWIIVLAPLLWAHFTAPPPPAPSASETGASHNVKRVILLTLDTLRHDAMGCYAPKTGATPRLDEFAKEAAVFTNAFSSAPWTLPAVVSLMTGTSPQVHQVLEDGNAAPAKLPTLAEYFKRAGYRTGAVGYNTILLPRTKLDRGFDKYRWFPVQTVRLETFDAGLTPWLMSVFTVQSANADILTNFAIKWCKENATQDFFLWVHYFDPHMPYAPPKPFEPADPEQAAMGGRFADLDNARIGHTGLDAKRRPWIRALYDAEVRYMDAEVGRFLDTLREMGLYDDSLIIVTSDHGEEFWDHDRFEHGHTMYNELLRIPLMAKLPQSHTSTTVDSYVGTQAILPTVLELCGIAPDTPQALPASFLPLLRDPHAPFNEKPILGGGSLFVDHMNSVIFDHMKYVHFEISGHEMLFNLDRDPQELDSIVFQDAAALAKGRELLDAAMTTAPRLRDQLGIGQEKSAPLAPQETLSLQALGYL